MQGKDDQSNGLDALPQRVSQRQLACHWGVSVRTLQRWNASGYGPPCMRIGGSVAYRISDIMVFEETCLHKTGAVS